MIKALQMTTNAGRFRAGGLKSRHYVAAVVLAFHSIAIWLLAHVPMERQPSPRRIVPTTVYLLPPPPRPPQRVSANQTLPTNTASRAIHPPMPATAAIPPLRPSPNADVLPGPTPQQKARLPASPAAATAPDITQKALNSVGKIVGELRKEGALPDSDMAQAKPSRFERAIAQAARPNTTSVESFTSNDGHLITRVSGPGGTYCVEAAQDSDADGIDHMQRGVGIRIVHCPY
ncbi:MAG TPA: hypothetical protein VF472_11145 [Burkholderiaceae bacterium]